MKKLSSLLLFFACLHTIAQENPNDLAKPIVAEGKRLYKSEMASWYGTDLFLENYKNRANVGGYFSYSENDVAKCIFFSKTDQPVVIGTISFDSTYNTKTAKLDLNERAFTTIETDLYTIRKVALETINSDTLFLTYKNTSLNLVPVIYNNEKKVYVLTGPEQNGVVIFGNDYLLTFNNNNTLLNRKQLHKNIIFINYGEKEEEGKITIGTVHSHLPETGDFITATDICTLMLYEGFAKWQQHNVVSKNYLNVWNCSKNELAIIPMSTIDKINKDQQKRKKEKSD
jgi:hypothetical protein